MTSYLSGIQIIENGYLILPEHDDQGNEPLLLDSVEQLWFKLHPRHEEVVFHQNDSKMECNVESKTHPPPLEKLQRFSDMSNKIVPIIEDIVKMQDRERFLTRKQREERENRRISAERLNHSKVKSLERQQQAHQRLSESCGNSLTDSSVSNLNHLNAAMRIVKTLNSIRLIYPLIINMLIHELREDKSLKISGFTLKEAGSKRKQWMLGDYVYDIISVKNGLTIKQQMELVLLPFLNCDEIKEVFQGNIDWNSLLPKLLRKSNALDVIPKLLNLDKDRVCEALKHDKAMMRCIEAGRSCSSTDNSFSKAVSRLKDKLEFVLGKRFKGSRLEVYGSCLSDLSLGKASDVDVSIHIPKLQAAKSRFERGELNATKYAAEVKKYVFTVQKRLSDFGYHFSSTEAITRARVPVVKGCYLNAGNPHTVDGSLAFDICFFNDIAVRNSTLLKEYTLVNPRAKNLMLMVKKWAKDHKVSSAVDDRLSSYAWVVLAIFYLQQIGMLPNLQSKDLMEKTGFKPDMSNPSYCINALDTVFVPWELVRASKAWYPREQLNDVPLSVLLQGFFHYMAFDFPFAFYAASIRTNFTLVPKPVFNKCSLSFFCIEDPFETFESHCPHDLGGPVNAEGQKEILFLLSDSAKKLQSFLTNQQNDGDEPLGPCPMNLYGTNAKDNNLQSNFREDAVVATNKGKSKNKGRNRNKHQRTSHNRSDGKKQSGKSSLKSRDARGSAANYSKKIDQKRGKPTSKQRAAQKTASGNGVNSGNSSGQSFSKQNEGVQNFGKKKGVGKSSLSDENKH